MCVGHTGAGKVPRMRNCPHKLVANPSSAASSASFEAEAAAEQEMNALMETHLDRVMKLSFETLSDSEDILSTYSNRVSWAHVIHN